MNSHFMFKYFRCDLMINFHGSIQLIYRLPFTILSDGTISILGSEGPHSGRRARYNRPLSSNRSIPGRVTMFFVVSSLGQLFTTAFICVGNIPPCYQCGQGVNSRWRPCLNIWSNVALLTHELNSFFLCWASFHAIAKHIQYLQ